MSPNFWVPCSAMLCWHQKTLQLVLPIIQNPNLVVFREHKSWINCSTLQYHCGTRATRATLRSPTLPGDRAGPWISERFGSAFYHETDKARSDDALEDPCLEDIKIHQKIHQKSSKIQEKNRKKPMSFRPRALSRLQVEGEHKRVSPDPSTTSGNRIGPIWSNGFNGSVRRMGRNYEKYIEIFTVGNCWNLLVTSSYLLVMLIWPPKDEPKRGSATARVSSFPIETCHAHVAPPRPTGEHLDFHLATEVKIPRRFRGSSTPRHEKRHPMPFGKQVTWQVTWQVTFIFSKIFKIMSHHVSSCLFVLEMQTLGPRCKRYGWWLTRPAARSKAMAGWQLQDILFLYTEGLEKV